jgi:hypothetical protein
MANGREPPFKAEIEAPILLCKRRRWVNNARDLVSLDTPGSGLVRPVPTRKSAPGGGAARSPNLSVKAALAFPLFRHSVGRARQAPMRFGTLTSKAVQFGRRLHVSLHLLLRCLKKAGRRLWAASIRRKALLWQRFYALRYQYLAWQTRHGVLTAAIVLLLFVGVTALWIPWLQKLLAPRFKTETSLASLRSLLVTLGGALIGAAAIVSSLVLFAMQVNIERMPHGLFRRLSTDTRLLGGFAATFLVAVAVAALSLVLDPHRIGIAVFGAFWGTAFILAMFHYCYRRALTLVNPVRQLGLVVRKTRGELHAWVRRAKRARPLLSGGDNSNSHRDDPHAPQHDLARTAFFQTNPRWTNGAMQGVRYAVSLARRYAEQGDHEVSAAAMNAIIAINRAYVEAKGRTFFAHELCILHLCKFCEELVDLLLPFRNFGWPLLLRLPQLPDRISAHRTRHSLKKLARESLGLSMRFGAEFLAHQTTPKRDWQRKACPRPTLRLAQSVSDRVSRR